MYRDFLSFHNKVTARHSPLTTPPHPPSSNGKRAIELDERLIRVGHKPKSGQVFYYPPIFVLPSSQPQRTTQSHKHHWSDTGPFVGLWLRGVFVFILLCSIFHHFQSSLASSPSQYCPRQSVSPTADRRPGHCDDPSQKTTSKGGTKRNGDRTFCIRLRLRLTTLS